MNSQKQINERRVLRRCRRRRGTAAVEFAVCLPLLTLLIFGAIEASSMIFLKQTLNIAAYEAAREAIRDTRGNAQGDARAQMILVGRNVSGFQVQFPRGESLNADRGTEVIVEVSAPSAANSPLIGQFIANRVLSARVVMIKQ